MLTLVLMLTKLTPNVDTGSKANVIDPNIYRSGGGSTQQQEKEGVSLNEGMVSSDDLLVDGGVVSKEGVILKEMKEAEKAGLHAL